MEPRPRSFYVLSAFFALFLVFLYGPTITIAILSFQGPQGGLTFPMRGTSLHWFRDLFEQQAVGDIWGSFRRSFALGVMVMVTTVIVSVMGGLAFRKRFAGSTVLFYLIITSLVIPSILVSLGVGLIFSQSGLSVHWSTSGFGAQLTWTLPFGLLIMFAVFNRFDRSYEEAAVRVHAQLRRVRPDAADRGQLQHLAAGNLWNDHQCHDAGDLRVGYADNTVLVSCHRRLPDHSPDHGTPPGAAGIGRRQRDGLGQ